MHLKYQFVIRKMLGVIAAVPVGKNASKINAMLSLNESAAFIMEKLSADTTEEAIAQALTEEYEGLDMQTALQDVHKMTEMLREKDLLED